MLQLATFFSHVGTESVPILWKVNVSCLRVQCAEGGVLHISGPYV